MDPNRNWKHVRLCDTLPPWRLCRWLSLSAHRAPHGWRSWASAQGLWMAQAIKAIKAIKAKVAQIWSNDVSEFYWDFDWILIGSCGAQTAGLRCLSCAGIESGWFHRGREWWNALESWISNTMVWCARPDILRMDGICANWTPRAKWLQHLRICPGALLPTTAKAFWSNWSNWFNLPVESLAQFK